jgi:hypothetical protein
MSLFRNTNSSSEVDDNSSDLPFIANREAMIRLKKKKGILIGNSAFVSLRDIKMHGFVGLEPRSSVSWIQGLFIKNPDKVYFAINEELFKESSSSGQYAIANDAYLNWGFGTKGRVILLGGMSTETETNVQVFYFENGRLVDLEERSIHGYMSPHYTETASTLIDELVSEAPGSRVFYASPLAKFSSALKNVEYVDSKIFRSLKYAKLEISTQSKKSFSKLPAGICILGIVFYSLIVGKGWTDYQSAISQYEESIKDPDVKIAGGVGGTLIDKIQQQRFFMIETRNQIALAEKTRSLVNALSKIGDVRIVDLAVKIPSGPDSQNVQERPDIKMVISVPNSNRNALDQGKDVLDTLSINTGLDLHMARQGWKDLDKRRVFTIEGFFHG